MPRFGLSNIYLKIGIALIALALVLAAWLWATMPWDQPDGGAAGWAARASFLGGIIIYVMGRLVHVFRTRSQA